MRRVGLTNSVFTLLSLGGITLGAVGKYWPRVEGAGVNFGAIALLALSGVLLIISAIIWGVLLLQQKTRRSITAQKSNPLRIATFLFACIGVIALGVSVLTFFLVPPSSGDEIFGLSVLAIPVSLEFLVVAGIIRFVMSRSHS